MYVLTRGVSGQRTAPVHGYKWTRDCSSTRVQVDNGLLRYTDTSGQVTAPVHGYKWTRDCSGTRIQVDNNSVTMNTARKDENN